MAKEKTDYRTLICPHISDCLFYKSWSKRTGEKRLNIIFEVPEVYQCLAYLSHDDKPSGTGNSLIDEFGKEIKADFFFRKKLKSDEMVCSHIEGLNLLKKLNQKND